MQFAHYEYVLLSRRGSIPRALGKGRTRDPLVDTEPVVIRRQVRRRKSLVDTVLVAVSMTRAAVIGVQDRRNR
jgi:hypothetical protein